MVAIGQIGIISAQSLSESPKPSPAQLAWHQLEYYWFAHFGPNTFSAEERVYKEAGVRFNLGSPKQLGEVLFDKLKLDPSAKKRQKLS